MSYPSWLIVGGGLHGVHVATRLLSEAGVPRDQLRIVDPERTLLDRWRRRTAATGMQFLRSPSVHHLAVEPFSLLKFAGGGKKKSRRSSGFFAPPYDRPSLRLFNEHSRTVVEEHRLEDCHVRDCATSINVEPDRVIVSTAGGDRMQADQIVLALGVEDNSTPSWVPVNEARINHLFALESEAPPSGTKMHVAVIGGGISAIQAALREVDRGHRVTLICRHELRKHQFDSDPGWLGPKYMRRFDRERSTDRRRAIIEGARHVGSIPPELFTKVQLMAKSGQVDLRIDEVESLTDEGRTLRLHLGVTEDLSVHRVVLATGLRRGRPGGKLVDQLISSDSFPCADCGYPIVDHHLRWHPRVFVTGALAELELGPAARNISGARSAGERIVSFVKKAHRDETLFESGPHPTVSPVL